MAPSLRAALAAALLASSVGCLFPEYTFDETEPSGGGSGATGGGGNGGSGGQPAGPGGSGGTGAGEGGEGGTGGAPPPAEDCFSPGDEDMDGLFECEDPDCAPDVECVDAIPVGWGTFGYTALFSGSAAADPACPTGAGTENYTGNGDLQNADAECTSCGCDAPMDRACDLSNDFDPSKPGVQPIYTRNVSCATGVATAQTTLTVPVPWSGTCSSADAAAGAATCAGNPCNQSVRVQAATVSGGSCTANGGEPSGGDPTWGDAVKSCRVDSVSLGGCRGQQTCVPRPPAPFESRVCVGKSGDNECPAIFTERVDAFTSFVDSRDCSDCTCGSPTGGTCRIAVTLHADVAANSCNVPIAPVATVESGSCLDLTGNPRVSGRTSAVSMQPTGGGCSATPGGGVPTGAVTPSNPTTFCCLPDD